MSRKFIATILAASLTITAIGAAPARAGNDDLARFLFGATALVIIGNALSDSNGSAAPAPRPRDHDYVHVPRVNRAKVLPRQCQRRARTALGHKTKVLGAKCLNRNYTRAHRLPQNCRLPFWTQNGRRPGYLQNCLTQQGYTLSKR